jgi:hypothetical protein
MKLTVVTDAEGNIIALSWPEVHGLGDGAPQSRVGLHAGQRQRVHHLDVPPELQNMSLVQIHASGRVEIKDKQPKLVKKIVSGARRKTRSKK